MEWEVRHCICWNKKLIASFQVETKPEGMYFPCHDKADMGQAGFQTCYYTQQKEKEILQQFPYSTKILKLDQKECMHCCGTIHLTAI